MAHLPSGDDLQAALDSFLKSQGEERQAKMSELMDLMKRARERQSQKDKDGPDDQECPEDVDDCDEITSPCCNAKVSTLFGTLPLVVRCFQCGQQYRMGELVRDLIKKA